MKKRIPSILFMFERCQIFLILSIFLFTNSCQENELLLKPSVETLQLIDTTARSIKAVGEIKDFGDTELDKYGFCWAKNEDPTLRDHFIDLNLNSVNEIFETIISTFEPNTNYFIRAFAANQTGTSYGKVMNFRTNDGNIFITTDNIKSITDSSALGGGKINDDGGSPVTERGICWNNSGNPTLADSSRTKGTGKGSFEIEMNNLNFGTTYYVRAFAINETGTSYGNTLSFRTDTFPTLTTDTISNITQTTASCGGRLLSNGGDSILVYGLCYSTSLQPTVEDNKTIEKGESAEFTSTLTDLESNTTYYIRAYARNSVGTTYGNERIFKTKEDYTTPVVATNKPQNLTKNSASVGGEVQDDGGKTVYERGIYYGISSNPEVTGSKLQVGSGTGLFTAELSDLTEGTTYYIKAYAINNIGEALGSEQIFKTLTIPTLNTSEVNSITYNSALSGGSITSDGDASITAKGVCWSTSPNPSLSDSKTNDGTGLDSYSSSLTGLNPNTTYYLRAYATNSVGTAYGEEKSFTTPLQMNGIFTDKRDKQEYNWVRVGTQIWMAENLNYDQSSYGNDWCYGGSSANCETYGRLYDWNAAMQGAASSSTIPSGVQGVCPTGWHLPSDDEWKILEIELGMNEIQVDNTGWRGNNEGSKLAGNIVLWNSGLLKSDPDFGSSEFMALPSGHRQDDGNFYQSGSYGYFWSTSIGETANAIVRKLGYNNTEIGRYGENKEFGVTIRCIKNDE